MRKAIEQEGSQNTKDRCKCGQSTDLEALTSNTDAKLITEEGHGNLFGRKV